MTLSDVAARLELLHAPDLARRVLDLSASLALAIEPPVVAVLAAAADEIERRTREAERLSAEVRRLRA